MKFMRKILLVCLSIILLVGCDYTSKKIVKNELRDLSAHSYLGGGINLVYAENSGGMLGLGIGTSEKTKLIIFRYFVVLMLALLFIYTITNKRISKGSIIAFIFIFSGGIGNLIDRFTNNGRVIDFIVMRILNYHTGIFNLADLYITTGVVLLVFLSLLNKYYKPESTE